MTTLGYFGLVAVFSLLALSDWRKAVYGALLLDFLRDPIRKLDPNESVWITVSVVVLWGVITLGMLSRSWGSVQQFLRLNPGVRRAIFWVVAALVPGAAMAVLLYGEGYKLLILGAISYLAPFAGIALGATFAKSSKDIERFLWFYVILNTAALTGTVAEYVGLGLPALGGLRGFRWIRYNGNETINLISGFYRSPDLMGLHAAHVTILSLILATRQRRIGWLWIGTAIFGGFCLFLSGRRKMLGIPLVFVGSASILAYLRGHRQFRRLMLPVGIAVVAGAAALAFTGDSGPVSEEYTNYASTLITQGAERSNQIVIGSVIGTLGQSGILGLGLGSATQGSRHVSSEQGGWQEDGVSRLFRELGIPGVIMMLIAALTLVGAIRLSVIRTEKGHSTSLLQLLLLSAVAANAASFIISHQQYSGDPASALLVLFMLGMAMSCSQLNESTAGLRRASSSR